jgi:hypothetical protein
MILSHVSATRLGVAYLVVTIALAFLPKEDIPETQFDEANTPTNEMVVENTTRSWECPPPITSVTPSILAKARRTSVHLMWPHEVGCFTNSPAFQELFCTFLC